MTQRLLTASAFVCAALALPPAGNAQGSAAGERVRSARTERTIAAHAGRYQRGENREELTDRTSHTLRIGPNGVLDISNIAGDITITRSGGNEARIEVVKTAHARTAEDAREMLGLVQVDVAERNGRGEVRTRYPGQNQRNNRRNANVSVAFTVAAPAGTRLTVNSISGNIHSTDIKGDLALESVSGTVRIANAGRVSSARSVSGDVHITDTRVEGTLEAGSVSGNVIARGVEARRLSLGSVSGNVTFDTVTCERVDANTVSGNVEFSGPLARSGRYDLKSHSGDVRVTVDRGAGFEVDANSFSGSVRADMPITQRTHQTDPDRNRRRSLQGVVGDGSAVLNLTTFSGSIVLSRR